MPQRRQHRFGLLALQVSDQREESSSHAAFAEIDDSDCIGTLRQVRSFSAGENQIDLVAAAGEAVRQHNHHPLGSATPQRRQVESDVLRLVARFMHRESPIDHTIALGTNR